MSAETKEKTLISSLSEDLSNLSNIGLSLLNSLSKNELTDIILDLSSPLSDRIKSLEYFYYIYKEAETLEIINRLSTIYQFSGTKLLETYLFQICTNSNIPSFLKIISAKSLCYFNTKLDIGYNAINSIFQDSKNSSIISTPCQIESVCLLMLHSSYKLQALSYFLNIINNLNLECDYRYKTILSLEFKNIPLVDYFTCESSLAFFLFDKNKIEYRILASQLLLQKCKLSNKIRNNVEDNLLSFSNNTELDYNLRADATDVILRMGFKKNQKIASKIILELGKIEGNVFSIFDNKQNVHIEEIEKSVLEALEFLSDITIKEKFTFDYIKNKIIYLNKSPKNIDKINISLNRIFLDRVLYSKYNFSLSHILIRIWSYLSSHESKPDIKQRLLEELIDMSGTCSSGFASRLVNVISGFGSFNLRISWRDQLISNFTGRLNAKARNITNNPNNIKFYGLKDDILLEDFQELVLNEMTINSNDYSSRSNFLRFFRKNMLSIRQELFEEFHDHITDTDFDLYFRSAISNYETGGYV